MAKSYFFRVHEQTPTRFWINNVTREQAQLAIDHGAVGCTQNPSYVWKMMTDEKEKPYVLELLDGIMKDERDDNEALVKLQRELVGGVAKVFKPMFDETRGKNGYVSIQGDPFQEDVDSIIRFARYNSQAGANITAKIPAIESGLKAIEILVKERIPINATECMAVRQVLDVCEIYEKTTKNMVNPAPLYYSVITGIYDEHITNTIKKDNIDISPDVAWYAGLAVAKKVYQIVKERGYNCQFIGGGARGLHHFTEMVGADCIITINWAGTADKLIEQNNPVVSRFFNPVSHAVIDELLEKVPDFRRAYLINAIEPEEYEDFGPVVLFRSQFESAWKNALNVIKERR
ncbi:MAG: transaldolase family protein [Christensenellales bacterium]